MKKRSQIRTGALLSYFAIAFNMIAGVIYTPWMISQIGQANFGLYTLATSLITMFVVDFGMSAAVSRFVSKYRAENDQEKVNNFLGIVYKLYTLIAAIILIALIVIGIFIDQIYANLTASEIETFKVLYVIVGFYSVVSFPFINLNGIMNAYEKFIEHKFADLFHKVFIIVAMVIALIQGRGVYALVTVNAISGLLTIAIKLLVIRIKTPVRVNFKFWDKGMLKEIFSFSFWTTIASLAQRLIFNISPSIIAMVSVTGAVGVAVFGLATTIEGYVFTFSTAINGMFMPRISRIVHAGKKEEELLPLMIRVGRIQCVILGILIAGFVALGQEFITDVWGKPDFAQSYVCAILLILPSFFYLPMQIANTTITVENKVKLRAGVYIIMGVVNVVLSFILSKFFGAFGASLSIFIAYMVRTILMVTIYHKVLKLDIRKFFKETYLKLVPQLVLAMIIGGLFSRINPITNPYFKFMLDGAVLVGSYFVIMWIKGFNAYEKALFKSFVGKNKK
ncbi:MAG: oligosaccharide flippase family protein [Clostridia bacterium]|nr:oligosaccharide flippase family protein [Clostridia bacterium]